MSAAREDIQGIFRDVLNAPDLVLTDDMTAADVPGWDSLSHISLMFSIESQLGVTFSDAEMSSFADVGELVRTVEAKLA